MTSPPVSPSPLIRRGGEDLKRGADAPLRYPTLLTQGKEGQREAKPLLANHSPFLFSRGRGIKGDGVKIVPYLVLDLSLSVLSSSYGYQINEDFFVSGPDFFPAGVYQIGQSFRFPDGHIGEHLAVDFHSGLLQVIHKLAIFKALCPAGGVNPQNPQPAHIAFSLTAVTVSIAQRFEHGLVSPAEEGMLGGSVSPGQG